MKKNFLLSTVSCVLIGTIIFTSCSKKDTASPSTSKKGYLKMKVNGVLKQYDTCWTSGFEQNAGTHTYYQINVLAGKPGEYMGVYVSDIDHIKQATYTSAINAETQLPGAGLGAYRTGRNTDIYISYQAHWPIYDVTINFSEFNADHTTGTFSGKMRLVGGDDLLDVTEGEFVAYDH